MDHPETAIESELLDLTGVTLDELRAFHGRERERNKQRLLGALAHEAVSWGMSDSTRPTRRGLVE
ncbi:hypothetical protein [Streptomyces sp. SID3343]|uniref:hypothetical protein n=1 Tax=Streptomyces sp. SID3343 TaxID=2690260 RepID=UPI001370D252|nr:hypothetical protein [Streptomyces sp. SID3343]MYV98700.1 hypothetical protein [Streptomyces sp. SID3343]